MSFVRKERSSSGRVAFRAVWLERGKKRSKSFAKEKEAKAHAALMHDTAGRLGVGDGKRRTFSQFAKVWLDGIEARGEQSPCSIRNYRTMLRRVEPLIGRMLLAEIGATDIDGAMTALLRGDGGKPLAPITVKGMRGNLSACFESARKGKLIVSNPVRDSAPVGAGRRGRPKTFSRDEIRAYVAEAVRAEPRAPFPGLSTLVRVLMLTGMRRCEALGLRWSRVDLDAGLISIDATTIPGLRGEPVFREQTKTDSSTRDIAIPGDLCERLRHHKLEMMKARLRWGREWADLDLVFGDHTGHLLAPGTVTDTLARVMKAANISGRAPAHAFRHSAATMLIASRQVDIVSISKRLGHADVSTTLNVYGSTDVEKDRGAAGVLAGLIGG